MDCFDSLSLVNQLLEELSSLGIQISDSQAQMMTEHLRLVIQKNKVLNLTRIVAPEDAVTLHLVDSLVPLQTNNFKPSESLRFLDIGTGAAFPGIPLGIATGMNGVLLDSVGKKVNAVNEFIDTLGLSKLVAVHDRVEHLAIEQPKSFDFVVARAVAQANVLIEYAAPLLKMNGQLVLEKANVTVDELNASKRAAKICGMKFVSLDEFDLPRDMGHRSILIYRKTQNPSIKLPRQIGVAKSHPLGL